MAGVVKEWGRQEFLQITHLSFFAFVKYFISVGACIDDEKTCILFKEEILAK